MARQKKQRWYRTSFLALKFDSIESELQIVREYVTRMEGFFRSQKAHLENVVKTQKEHMTEEQYDQYLEIMSDDFWLLNSKFTPLMRESTFVAIMSLLEVELVGLCHMIKRQKHISATFTKLPRATTLESVREYIKQQTGINVGVQPTWKTMDTLNTIRNALVHNDGRIKGKKNQVNGYVRRNRKIVGIYGKRRFPSDRIELKDGFLEYTIDILIKWSNAAHRRLEPLHI